jgi:probable HAF family extracellular repeat protein
MSVNITLLTVKVLAIAGATQMTANDINDNGQIVGQFIDPSGTHGFVFEEDSFCLLDYPGATSTNILGINNLGQMVGMFTTLTATAGFLYDRGTFSPALSFPGAGNLTIANGINDRGHIVGVYQDALPGEHSFIYKAGKYTPLTYPGAKETAVDDINNSGEVIGYFPDAKGTHGFVYLENVGVFTPPLNDPPSTNIPLRGINNGGQIVGGRVDANGNEQPFLYMDGGINPIVIPGAISAGVGGINDRGQVAGNFRVVGGGEQSFVAAIRF